MSLPLEHGSLRQEPGRLNASAVSLALTGPSQHAGAMVTIICLLIGLISAYDAYLTMAYSPFLRELESNPIGRRIMTLDQQLFVSLDKVAFFLGLKFAGTILAITVIHMLYHYWRRWSLLIAGAIGLFQVGLLIYLKFG